MRILISDKTSPNCAKILADAGHHVDEKFGLTPEELLTIIPSYEGLIVRSATKVTREVLEKGKTLKVVGRAGSGVDNIDLKAAQKRNIVVMNTPGANTNAVVELTFAYMFALSRNLYQASLSLKQRKWEKKLFVGCEIFGKTLGIIGCGKIGSKVAIKAIALGMEVLCYDPYCEINQGDRVHLQFADRLDELLIKADYISIHVPKNPETINLISKNEFNRMKQGVYFINCSRGGIVNEPDLVSALNVGIVKGAGIDVFQTEPPIDPKLIEHPHVICTPHLGASTREAQENVAVQIAQQIADMFAGKGIRHQVNIKK
jgi:D-3-phosphoglycerate dehydrogenase